jgi:GT2 family glycosyltransferase
MTVHVVIPVHNCLEETKNCVSSLNNQSYTDITVYIVDDGSSDETVKWVKSNDELRLITGDGNLWWTGAVAKGVEHILPLAVKNDYIMTLNNDVMLKDSAISILVKNATNLYDQFICGAISVDRDTKICMSSGAVVNSWLFNLNIHPFRNLLLSSINKKIQNVSMLTGRTVLYPISVIKNIGNFNCKALPHYGGDIEMTVRAKRYGYSLCIVTEAIAYVNRDTTGLNSDDVKLSLFDKIKALFSMRSANNIYHRSILAYKIAPLYALPTYLLISYLKILFSIFMTGKPKS